jgi:hypothetical protein
MNPAACNKLAEIFPPNVSRAKQERNATIAEMCKYLIFKDKRLYKTSGAMLTHLCRIADNHHCARAGRFIVCRQVDMSWEYSVLLEIEQCEILVHRPTKPVAKKFKAMWLSVSDRESLNEALRYYDVILKD